MTEREFVIALNISAAEYQRMYRGDAQQVIARDLQGRRVQFPAAALRPFVTHSGISGVYVLRVDANNRLLELRRRDA